MKTRTMLAVLALNLVFGMAWAQEEAVKTGEADNAAARDLRVIHVGNSHSHTLRMIPYLAGAVGHKQTLGDINILGAPLWWNWDHPEQNKWPQKLGPEHKWDVITLLAWDGRDDEYAVKFAAEAYKGNPECQVMLYTIWPDGHHDWKNPPATRRESHTEKVAAAIAKAFPDKPKPLVIPSSILMREIGLLADRGEFPGIPNRHMLQSDGGHLSKTGMYAINTLVCAMLHRENPLDYPDAWGRRYPDGGLRKGWHDSLEIAPETARAIRELAWDVLLTYPPAGMATELVIADRELPVALAGRGYEARLKGLNTGEAANWSIKEGRLPEGMRLSAGGVISGRTDKVGTFPLTVQLSDAGRSFERRLSLCVGAGSPPRIGEQTLRPAGLDEYCFQALKAEDGVGTLTWDVADGALPFGIDLSPVGVLSGTPGEAGEFRFKLRATDAHPDGPRSATRDFTWTIGPASDKTLPVRRVQLAKGVAESSVVKTDGVLDEEVWDLKQPVARKVAGNPTAGATFDAFRIVDDRGRTRRLHVAVSVRYGPAGKSPKDAVHLYLDGRHNKETMYNQDDVHVLLPREGKARFLRSHTPWWFMQSKVTETDDGYTVEVAMGPAYFKGNGITVPFGDKAVYGFDIAVEEGDEKTVSRQTWRGDGRIDEDTSSFGTVVLTP